MNNDSGDNNFSNVCNNQNIEGKHDNTWVKTNVSELYNIVKPNGNMNDQYYDCTMYDREYLCVWGGDKAGNGSTQEEYFNKVYDTVRCDFISILKHINTNECWLVYLHGNGTFKNGFYSLLVDSIDGSMSLHTHGDPDPGYLTVAFSCILYVVFDNYINIEKITNQEKAQARVIFDNFKQDDLYIKSVNMTYDQYMVQVITNIILNQEKIIKDMKLQAVLSEEMSFMCDLQSDLNDASVDAVVPNVLENLEFSGTPMYHKIRDPMFPDKTKGFINHKTSNFRFIGPDRAPIDITTIEQCIRVAKTISSTGVPNYCEARIPLVSGLNIEAWETYLRDYPDPLLIEYLKFGFPMSISKNDALNITTVVNHHSATQFTEEVDEYFKKELEKGAILGPIAEVRSDMFHCSPLLTRPKDAVKRRVILNLSHPNGGSVNEFVDSARFDHRPFTL